MIDFCSFSLYLLSFFYAHLFWPSFILLIFIACTFFFTGEYTDLDTNCCLRVCASPDARVSFRWSLLCSTLHGLSLTHNGVLPRSGPCVDAPPYPRHGWSAQEGIVDRPGMERRAWLVFLFIFALFQQQQPPKLFHELCAGSTLN